MSGMIMVNLWCYSHPWRVYTCHRKTPLETDGEEALKQMAVILRKRGEPNDRIIRVHRLAPYPRYSLCMQLYQLIKGATPEDLYPEETALKPLPQAVRAGW